MRTLQARIHTGFHRFAEIGQIFEKKYIFNNKKTSQVEILFSLVHIHSLMK